VLVSSCVSIANDLPLLAETYILYITNDFDFKSIICVIRYNNISFFKTISIVVDPYAVLKLGRNQDRTQNRYSNVAVF
jgi:hypothetical protein